MDAGNLTDKPVWLWLEPRIVALDETRGAGVQFGPRFLQSGLCTASGTSKELYFLSMHHSAYLMLLSSSTGEVTVKNRRATTPALFVQRRPHTR